MTPTEYLIVTRTELRVVVASHGAWLRGELDGVRADLTGVDLTGANLIVVDLTDAILTRADLREATLTGANMTRANLTDADLTNADLQGVDLTDADLSGATLQRAKLTGAILARADLRGVDLTNADLQGVDLTDADINGSLTDLTGAIGFRFPDAPDPRQLRLAVADFIEAHPELHDQMFWGYGVADPHCGTPCCVAGRACHLGGGTRGQHVRVAALRLLWLDGAPMPRFDPDASREEILTALRTMPKATT